MWIFRFGLRVLLESKKLHLHFGYVCSAEISSKNEDTFQKVRVYNFDPSNCEGSQLFFKGVVKIKRG